MELRYNCSSAPSALYQWHQVIAWHDSVANTLNIQVDHGAVSSLSYSGGGKGHGLPHDGWRALGWLDRVQRVHRRVGLPYPVLHVTALLHVTEIHGDCTEKH